FERLLLGLGLRADGDLPGFLALGQLALQLDMEEAVLEIGAGDLDIFGKLETQLEGALGNAAMEEFAGLLVAFLTLPALDRQAVLLGLNGDLVGRKAGDGDRDAIGVIADLLDVIGRVGFGLLADNAVEP